jgi:alkylated DNA repair protein (DNA oxidative demethylase)
MNLFDDLANSEAVEPLAEGAVLLRGFAAPVTSELLSALHTITDTAPFRHMVTPGGFRMSVAMTNCGQVGWVSDRSGYRYDPVDPGSGQPWPALPPVFRTLARDAAATAGYENFNPDCCLVNRYEPGTKLSLHQDKDEHDFTAPIVSVSLGLPAVFLWGGLKRKDRARRIRLESGDIAVWGGVSRLTYHGIAPLAEGDHPATGRVRINLTFRKAL